MSLSAYELRRALDGIALFRADPEGAQACPRCGAPGLAVSDRSVRPYAEWYHLACAACGLDETVHIPLRPPVMGGQD